MRRITVLLIALMLAAAGCSTESQDEPSGEDAAGAPTSPAPDARRTLDLTGNTWRLERIVDGDDATQLPGRASATLVFNKKRVQTHSGCNSGGGSVKVSDETLTFGPLMSTLMGCPEKWKQQVEAAYGDVLRGAADYVIDGDRLTISKADSSLEFVAR
ncbi:hypothetical protein ASG90_05985 [Nocardioides sp. Soil797]|nr:hypothetical protein ASG90_05985 [Nocardioides sp. Soil797]